MARGRRAARCAEPGRLDLGRIGGRIDRRRRHGRRFLRRLSDSRRRSGWRSCGPRCCGCRRCRGSRSCFVDADDMVCLWALAALDDVELDIVTFLQALVAFALDGTVVNEDVCPAFVSEKAEALRVVEPLHRTLILCQFEHSLRWPEVGWLARIAGPVLYDAERGQNGFPSALSASCALTYSTKLPPPERLNSDGKRLRDGLNRSAATLRSPSGAKAPFIVCGTR